MFKRIASKCVRYTVLLAALLIILFAVLLNVARLVTPLLNKERAFLERWASQALHQPVRIGHVAGVWQGFEPELQFENVVLLRNKHGRSIARVQRLNIAINLWQSLLQRKLLPGHLMIQGVKVGIYQNKAGQFRVIGVKTHGNYVEREARSQQLNSTLLWVLTQSDLSVRDVDVNLYGKQGVVIPIRHLRLEANSHFNDHRMSGVAYLAQTIPTQMKFILDMRGYEINQQHLNAKLYVRVKRLVLNQWLALLPQTKLKNINVLHGELNASVWMDWHDGKLVKAQSVLNGNHIGLRLINTKRSLLVNHVGLNALWQRDATGWELKARNIKLTLNGDRWDESQFGLRFYKDDKTQAARYLMRLGYLRLQEVQQIGAEVGLWPLSVSHAYQQLQPQGEVRDLFLEVAKAQDAYSLKALQANFTNLKTTAWKKFPGVIGLNGSLNYVAPKGVLTLQGSHMQIAVPGLYSHVLRLHYLQTTINWVNTSAGLTLAIPSLALADGNLSLNGQLHFNKPINGKPELQLLFGYSLRDVKAMHYYVPDRVAKRQLLVWVRQAFKQGDIPDGRIVFNGSPLDFPFENHEGQFEFYAKVHKIQFHFAPYWPAIMQLQGEVQVKNKSLQVEASSGSIVGNPLYDMHATIPDLANQKLTLDVSAQSDSTLQKGFAFINQAPLVIKNRLQGLIARGPMHLNLGLHILIEGKKSKVGSRGAIAVHDASLKLRQWSLPIENVNGVLSFDNEKFSSKNLKAQLFGEPITANVITIEKKAKRPVLQISAGGKLNIQKFAEHYPMPLRNFFSGVTDFRALLQLHDERSAAGTTVNIVTDLNGVSAPNLPPPYNKAASESRMLHLKMHIRDQKPLTIRVKYAGMGSAALSFKKQGSAVAFYAGEMHLGSGGAHWQQQKGLLVTGKLAYVNWTRWQTFLQDLVNAGSMHQQVSRKMSAPLRVVELQINHLDWLRHDWRDVYLKLMPKPTGWMLNVQSDVAAGILFIPNNKKQAWNGRFKKLYLPIFKKNKGEGSTRFDPHQIPPIDFVADDFHYGKMQFGKVKLLTAPMQLGVRVNQLKITAPLFQVAVKGRWQQKEDRAYTYFNGGVRFGNVGLLLRQFGVTKMLADGKGAANFALSWRGPPYSVNKPTLGGDVKLELLNGRILNINKNTQSELGLGRLLNLFSLQSLPQRLTLNFSDLTKKGFAFKKIKGNFEVDHGNVNTNDAYINGNIARVLIRGRIGLAKKDYGLKLFVIPYITSSLPLIVGIAGGPVAGAVTWVFDKIFGPEIGKAAGLLYSVKGPWEKPKITRIQAKRAYARKKHLAPVERRSHVAHGSDTRQHH